MESVAIIGAGRLGSVLAHAMSQAGLPVSMIASRTASSAETLASALPRAQAVSCQQAATADLVLVTVPDDAIASVANSVTWQAGHYVVHCSGATEISVLDLARNAGAMTGGFHPIQIFSDVAGTLPLLPGTTVGIEAEGVLKDVLCDIAARLHMVPMTVAAGQRALYHGGSLFMSSFLLSLFDASVQTWRALGMTETQTLQALLPLARGVVGTAANKGVAASLAGPISRGDVQVMTRHIAAFAALGKDHLEKYLQLSGHQLMLARQAGKLPQETIAAMQQVVDDAGAAHE